MLSRYASKGWGAVAFPSSFSLQPCVIFDLCSPNSTQYLKPSHPYILPLRSPESQTLTF